MLRWRRFRSVLLVCAAAAIGAAPCAAQDPSYVELQRLSGVLNHVRLNYVDDVAYADVVRGAIRGALASLDPHSYFYARADWQRLDALERGLLASVGVHLEEVDDRIVVRSVDVGGPAARAGVMPADRIVDVDGVTIAGLNAREVELRLAGEDGSRVVARLERGPRLDPVVFEVRLERDMPDERSVGLTETLGDGIGYVALTGFGAEAARELDRAIRDLRDEGADRLILDLRGNPGGLVTQAAGAAALFFDDEVLLFRTRGRKADANEEYVTDSNGRFRQLPVVVLIDEASASAAEALAATLQDHDRALLAGRRSFGKALVQAPFFLQGGDVVWLTIAHVESPTGRVIQRPYRGRRTEEYRATAGADAAADSVQEFRTPAGRVVLGGGGVAPDVPLAAPAELPAWWSEALQSGMASAVADSVAHAGSLSLGDETWRDAHLVTPLAERARRDFAIDASATPLQRARVGLLLAERVVAATSGPEAAATFRLRNDPDVRAALALFPELEARLSSAQ